MEQERRRMKARQEREESRLERARESRRGGRRECTWAGRSSESRAAWIPEDMISQGRGAVPAATEGRGRYRGRRKGARRQPPAGVGDRSRRSPAPAGPRSRRQSGG